MALGPPNVEKLKARGDIAGLKRALRHKSWEVRNPAAEALAELGPAGVQTLLDTMREVEALGPGNRQDADWDASNAAGRGLRTVQDPGSVDLLLATLAARTDHDTMLMDVVAGLGHSGDPRAVAPLIALLGGYLGNSAAAALGQLGGDEAIASVPASRRARTPASRRSKRWRHSEPAWAMSSLTSSARRPSAPGSTWP